MADKSFFVSNVPFLLIVAFMVFFMVFFIVHVPVPVDYFSASPSFCSPSKSNNLDPKVALIERDCNGRIDRVWIISCSKTPPALSSDEEGGYWVYIPNPRQVRMINDCEDDE